DPGRPGARWRGRTQKGGGMAAKRPRISAGERSADAAAPALGQSRVTINHVAALAGVSPTTVSHVLSGKRLVAEETRGAVYDALKPADMGVPVVCVGHRLDHPRIDVVTVDDERGSYEVTRHLLTRQPQRVAMIQGLNGTPRLSGFTRAVAEAGHTLDPSLMVT